MDIQSKFPLIDEIKDDLLRKKTISALEKAIKVGRWNEEDLNKIPFTLLIPELMVTSQKPMISLIEHINAVSKAAMCIYNIYNDLNLSNFLDRDAIISGALLHDIGKFVEYEKNSIGKIVQGKSGTILRHPAQGLELIAEFDFPLIVRQAVVFHSKEGKEINLLPEVEIISRSDFLCFTPIKKILQK